MHNMEQENDPKMPNWSKIKALIPRNNLRLDMLEFSQTHGSTNGKIAMADYHYHILDQLYRTQSNVLGSRYKMVGKS
jgi:hypothetical protein